MSITAMLSLIWYIIRDYSASTYSLKQVCTAAAEQLEKEGHTVTVYGRGKLNVDGNTYLIYKLSGWNRYEVRNII